MTLLEPPLRMEHRHGTNTEETSLRELLNVALDSKGMIVGCVLVAMGVGAGWAILKTPLYEADTLIQVESRPSAVPLSGTMGQAANTPETEPSAMAEIHILRSRFVVGQAVEKLQLELSVTPKYLPGIGAWLSRRATEPSNPHLLRRLGVQGYVWGNESLQITRFDVLPPFQGRPFTARLTEGGYELLDPDGQLLAAGRIGQPLEFAVGSGRGVLLVESAVGRPGAEFYVERQPTLRALENLQSALQIEEQGKQSGVIRTRLAGPDPEKLALTLNEISAAYLRQNISRKSAEAEKTLGFLGSMLPSVRAQVEEAEKKFNKFRNRYGTFDLNTEGRMAMERSAQLQAELVQLQQTRRDLESRLGPAHPSMQATDARIAGITRELGTLTGRVRALPNVEQDMLRLSRDLKLKSDLYATLQADAQQLQLIKEGKVGNVRVIDPAFVPVLQTTPHSATVVAGAGALGLVLGLVLAFLRNSLRRGIKDPAEIERQAGLHLISTVPLATAQNALARSRRRDSVRVLAAQAPQDAAVESLRGLRTALQFTMAKNGSNVVLITGPTPGVGKSFTSVNLAAVLGAANRRVLLIDADLRKGKLNDCFRLPREGGFSDVISHQIAFKDAVHRGVLPNVDLLSTGATVRSPADLLITGSAGPLLNDVALQYDVVIVDAPAVLVASDAAILASLAGTVLLVARSGLTRPRELQETARRLAESGVDSTRVVFNGMGPDADRYGLGEYGYDYGMVRGA
ncbi:polysaccharide biosynthesis tyrosine autokinase [Ramlibacter rhizophilus]|uniref:Polysaccharide biosynthesis tyrosine autokinase n=1 Tax=Ramlibacter rhizophilus TaxID=1781167 RepID=A0A4Z0BFG4_9BURK|nr:polysaccharide biosynthesis tyrosine autokinase [Ramlibacter rhizophilus]TFY96874.1 polysaccharide biosynthesis tyrosine autokinase [Ramlibacter rhizophilus]